jgi:hypothetical protein
MFIVHAYTAEWLYVPGYKGFGPAFLSNQSGLLTFGIVFWRVSFPFGAIFLLLWIALLEYAKAKRSLISAIGLLVVVFGNQFAQFQPASKFFCGGRLR